MIIDLSDQMKISAGLPPKRAEVFVNSSLPIALLGIPEKREDGEITAVAVTVTNADAMPTTAPCVKEGAAWRVAFAPSCFPTYGFVERGYKVVATVKTPTGGTMSTTLAVGDVEIKADAPTATPGDPEKNYQIKGEDIYVKTRVIDGVQHYACQEMSYDAEMGAWGADWLGDYILVDGEFVEVNEND